MPIPKRITSASLVGKNLKTARRIYTGACAVDVPPGAQFQVLDAGRGFMLKSEDQCPCCGIAVRLDHVTRDQVFLPDDENAPHLATVAFWNNRAHQNDHTWSQCSNCGFTVENYKAIIHGLSSDDYAGVKYKFCPKCGKRMAIRNFMGKVVL